MEGAVEGAAEGAAKGAAEGAAGAENGRNAGGPLEKREPPSSPDLKSDSRLTRLPCQADRAVA